MVRWIQKRKRKIDDGNRIVLKYLDWNNVIRKC